MHQRVMPRAQQHEVVDIGLTLVILSHHHRMTVTTPGQPLLKKVHQPRAGTFW